MTNQSNEMRIAGIVAQFRRAESGQALIEFALVVPFLLLFIVGIIEFGRGWNLHQSVTDAAREAARTAVIDDPDITVDSVRATARHALARAGMNPANATITLSGTFHDRGSPYTVAISVPYRLAFFGALKGWTTGQSTVTLRSNFTMRNE